MKKLGVIANCGKPRAPEVLARLAAKARDLRIRLYAGGETARLLRCAREVPAGKQWGAVDALVAMGGDGTMLKAVRDLDGLDKPVLGVNIGALGFMTSVAEQDLERAVECLVNGDFTTSTRSVAECTALRGRKTLRYRALNDVVLTNSGSPRVVTLDVSVDEQPVTSFVCDGLIVSTPTGSTGHSLSAGGPIVTPGSPVFVISLICAHTLSNRPLVVPDDGVVRVQVVRSSANLRLTVDGQVGSSVAEGDRVEVRRSRRSVRFVHLPGYSYFSVLRQKLHWRGSNV